MTFPTLDLGMQAERLVVPVTRWGSIGRTSRMEGTYHLYTDDRKFAALLDDPDALALTGCACAVEPNLSTHAGLTPGQALVTVFRKRRVAARWQALGIRILVDLDLEPCFRHLALEGVPRGWRAYATRSHREANLDIIAADFRQAVAHAGTPDILFAVFGGGRDVKLACAERGWQWVPESAHVARGRESAYAGDDAPPARP